MSSALAIYLTQEAPASYWNPKSNLVFGENKAQIILVEDEALAADPESRPDSGPVR